MSIWEAERIHKAFMNRIKESRKHEPIPTPQPTSGYTVCGGITDTDRLNWLLMIKKWLNRIAIWWLKRDFKSGAAVWIAPSETKYIRVSCHGGGSGGSSGSEELQPFNIQETLNSRNE